jgi:hypothetical protein
VIRLATAVLIAQSLALGQLPEERLRATQLLASSNLAQKAWGVYLAGVLHQDELDELLIARLAEASIYSDSKFGSEEYAYVLTLFDALIQSGRSIPADLLPPFAKGWRDEVLIALSQSQGSEDFLLDMRAETLNQAQWLTVNNRLLSLKSSRFFVATLTELRIRHRFILQDDEGSGFAAVAEEGAWEIQLSGCPGIFRRSGCTSWLISQPPDTCLLRRDPGIPFIAGQWCRQIDRSDGARLFRIGIETGSSWSIWRQ